MKGREQMLRLEEAYRAQGMTPQECFNAMDTSNKAGKKDGKVSIAELRKGLTRITRTTPTTTTTGALSSLVFTREQVEELFRFMDPNEDAFIDQWEFDRAMHLAHMAPRGLAKETAAGRIMERLDEFMVDRSMRVVDLFKQVDVDHDGSLQVGELRNCLDRLLQLEVAKSKKRAAQKVKNSHQGPKAPHH